MKEFDIRQFLPDVSEKVKPEEHRKVGRDASEIVRSPVKEPQQSTMDRLESAQAQQPAPGTTLPQETSAKIPPVKRKYVVNGVGLTDEQTRILLDGGHIFLENMTKKDGIGKLSAFVFLCDEKKKIFYSYDDPDKFVKYGKWEMRIRDKQQIDAGRITHAKIKYWGGGFAHPYLWKPGVVDEGSAGVKVISELVSGNEYRGSWSDPKKIAAAAKNEPDNDRQKQVQTSQTPLETVADTVRTVGRAGVETFTEAASAIGSLFDITPNPNNPTEDPDQLQPLKRKKPKKKKTRHEFVKPLRK